MMTTAWNLVLNSLICNAWLSCRILALYQELIVQDIKKLKKNAIGKARAIASSSCFYSEMFIFKQRLEKARELGKEYIESGDKEKDITEYLSGAIT